MNTLGVHNNNLSLRNTSDRKRKLLVGLVVYTPFVGSIAAAYHWYNRGITGWQIFAVIAMWQLGCLSITIGFHRWLTHQGFDPVGKAGLRLKKIILIGACMAGEGPPSFWVAAHKKHHSLSDKPGDPHSPLEGFWHAHFGWMFKIDPTTVQSFARYLIKDQIVQQMNRQYFFWLLLRPALAFCLLGGWHGLWLNLFAMWLTHHTTWSVNSVCHTWGKRRFETPDRSMNNFLIALLSAGEGNHNNHHGMPRSARHGLKWWEPDLSWLFILAFYKLKLITEPEEPTDDEIKEQQQRLLQTNTVKPAALITA